MGGEGDVADRFGDGGTLLVDELFRAGATLDLLVTPATAVRRRSHVRLDEPRPPVS